MSWLIWTLCSHDAAKVLVEARPSPMIPSLASPGHAQTCERQRDVVILRDESHAEKPQDGIASVDLKNYMEALKITAVNASRSMFSDLEEARQDVSEVLQHLNAMAKQDASETEDQSLLETAN